LEATGIDCRVAAPRTVGLDMLEEVEYRMSVAALKSKLNW